MLFFLLINFKMSTVVDILIFMSRKISCSAELSMNFLKPRAVHSFVHNTYVVLLHLIKLVRGHKARVSFNAKKMSKNYHEIPSLSRRGLNHVYLGKRIQTKYIHPE